MAIDSYLLFFSDFWNSSRHSVSWRNIFGTRTNFFKRSIASSAPSKVVMTGERMSAIRALLGGPRAIWKSGVNFRGILGFSNRSVGRSFYPRDFIFGTYTTVAHTFHLKKKVRHILLINEVSFFTFFRTSEASDGHNNDPRSLKFGTDIRWQPKYVHAKYLSSDIN